MRDYLAERVVTQIRVLSAEASPLKGLEASPERVRNHRTGRKSAGCMGIGAICEFGRSDLEIAALIDAARRPLISAIRHQIEEGKSKGKIGHASCGGIRYRHLCRYQARGPGPRVTADVAQHRADVDAKPEILTIPGWGETHANFRTILSIKTGLRNLEDAREVAG